MNIEKYHPYMLELLKRLVETESPSNEKTAVDQVGKIITDELSTLNAGIELIRNEITGDHIIAKFYEPSNRIDENGEKGFLILCHFDTVYPIGTIRNMPFQKIDDRLMGPGVADMKSGSVIGLTAIKSLIDDETMPSKPITFLFTSDEEIGSGTSKEWIEKLARDSSLVLVLEPGMPDGSIKTWRKGVGNFQIDVQGKAAHSGGNHAKGSNAIEELAHQVIRIQSLTNYDIGTTLNVGVVKGGTVVNAVPDHAWMGVDMRVMQPGEAERIKEVIYNLQPVLQGTTIKVTGGLNRPPMPFNDLMRMTFNKAKHIATGIGLDLTASGTGGASDANFISPMGIPVLDGLGAVGGDYHSKDEYIVEESLISRTQLLTTILQNW
ncbi:M20 family metallopeptidase [Chloroflexota bacterium]